MIPRKCALLQELFRFGTCRRHSCPHHIAHHLRRDGCSITKQEIGRVLHVVVFLIPVFKVFVPAEGVTSSICARFMCSFVSAVRGGVPALYCRDSVSRPAAIRAHTISLTTSDGQFTTKQVASSGTSVGAGASRQTMSRAATRFSCLSIQGRLVYVRCCRSLKNPRSNPKNTQELSLKRHSPATTHEDSERNRSARFA